MGHQQGNTMESMFQNCFLTNLDDVVQAKGWNTSMVTNMSRMFNYINGSGKTLDLSKWDVSSVTTMSSMFNMSLLGG